MNRSAGLIYGSLEHHLDHVGVFCSEKGIPLLVTDEEIYALALQFYPDLKVVLLNPIEAPFYVVSHFNTIYYSTPRIMFDEVFFIAERTLNKKVETVWLPHGNSDKGHASYFMEGLENEKQLLIYGPKMSAFLKEKNVSVPHLEIGNFRLHHYQKNQLFYDPLVPSLPDKKIVLYAPTWKDVENSTSFFQIAPLLIQQVPPDFFLLIKLHPNLLHDIRTHQLILQHETSHNTLFLPHFPPVYPLLNKAAIYLGDMSSIGYDFLSFNRPMFFFNPAGRAPTDPGLFLHTCGRTILPREYGNIFQILTEDQSHLTQVREELYAYTFGVKPLDMDRSPHRSTTLSRSSRDTLHST